MTQTIFQEYAKESKGSNTGLAILFLVLVAIALAIVLTSDGQYRIVGPGPLLIFLLLRMNKKNTADIKFFVNQKGSDFEFGYHNPKGKLVGPFPIDEYTYWCYEHSAHRDGWNFHLNFQINTGSTTIYLQQKIVARTPPAGWQRTPQKIGEGGGVFQCPNLVRLASLIDAGSEASQPANES